MRKEEKGNGIVKINFLFSLFSLRLANTNS